MHIPVIPDLLKLETRDRRSIPSPMSIESQLKLRSLYEYLDFCRQALDEIQRDIVSRHLPQASERLEKFCVEADSWGFDALYEIALSLQVLLLNASGHIQGNGISEALRRGLEMLSALLEQCERDFCYRLATADTLDCINEASGN
jgi:hypothetical protein